MPKICDIRCFECLGYGHVAYECQNKKIVTSDNESGVNVEMVLSVHEKKHEGQLCVKRALFVKTSVKKKILYVRRSK